ncbi:acetate kinase [Ascobolus immersus RN42]|uniref:Probable acetate kinase n=1 Tax=Ascobolus immersus RN42 TaxID=1160509 RepID=A0A3N4I9P2_ASCIM|nr:acetate kinase [Ascobolus immersus RN42]
MPSDEQLPHILLGINAGSSSVKFALFTVPREAAPESRNATQILTAEVAGLTSPPAKFTFQSHLTSDSSINFKKKELDEGKINSHEDAFDHFISHLSSTEIPISDSLTKSVSTSDISHIFHRIVHGGPFQSGTHLSKKHIDTLTQLSDLAPLHNAVSLPLVQKTNDFPNPETSNIAFFDTSFHTTLPASSSTYLLSKEHTKNNSIRKYGFHGLSYAYTLHLVSQYLDKPEDKCNIIALHLGSGCSACAIKDGKSIDTSMGLTPLQGLPGATRSGDLDPSAVFHMVSKASNVSYKVAGAEGITVSVAEKVLNKESGWKGVTGESNFAVIVERALKYEKEGKEEDETFKLVLDVVVERIVGYVARYYVRLGGKVDALVFAGGIGEKADVLRKRVVEGVECLGFQIDGEKNEEADVDGDDKVVEIGGGNKDEKRVLVVKTDETYQMARELCSHEKFWNPQDE